MLVPPSVPIPDTLKGIDDLIRTNFEEFRAVWFTRLLIATFLVVFGLVLEGPELWHEIHSITQRWMFRRHFHFSLPEEHTPEWAKLFAFVGWMFIVVGVAGEFVADSFLSKADGYVQKFDEILLAETTRSAGNARISAERAALAAAAAKADAKTAKEEAGAVKGIADAARKDAKDALAKAQVAQRSLAHAESDAAKAQAAASDALSKSTEAESHLKDAMQLASEAQAELKRVTSPRTLGQSSQVVATLKAFKDQEYVFSGVAGDKEAMEFLVQIDDLLKSAEWKGRRLYQLFSVFRLSNLEVTTRI